MRTFEQDLAAGREEQWDRSDPEWCVLRAVAEHYGLTTDPLDEQGSRGPWYQAGLAVNDAIRLLVRIGYTQSAAAKRLGFSASKAGNAWRPPDLHDEELEMLERAEDLYRGELMA